MFNVTDAAAAHLAEILADSTSPEMEDQVVRLVHQPDGLALTLDHSRPGDTTFSHGDVVVLALDADVLQLLGETTLDVETTDAGLRLALR